jgi:hypothetical protein
MNETDLEIFLRALKRLPLGYSLEQNAEHYSPLKKPHWAVTIHASNGNIVLYFDDEDKYITETDHQLYIKALDQMKANYKIISDKIIRTYSDTKKEIGSIDFYFDEKGRFIKDRYIGDERK